MQRADPRLSGPTRIVARTLWLALVAPSLALFVLGLPTYYERLQQPCDTAATCAIALALSARGIRAFTAQGVSMSHYAAFATVFWSAIVLTWSGIGFLIFWRRSNDWMALLAAFMLAIFNLSYPGLSITALALRYPALNAPVAIIGALGIASMALFFLLFPDGRLAPRWTGLAIPLIIAQAIAIVTPPATPINSTNWPGWLNGLLAFTIYGAIIFSQVYRYRRISSAVERQQTKWVAFAIITVAIGFLVMGALFSTVFSQVAQPDTPASLVSLAYPLLLLLIPISTSFAILRYRLWDIDLVIRRALVYSLLTVFVVGVYVVVVGYLGALFRTGSNLLISLIATGLVAVLFQPLRGLLQRSITRLFYGLRDEPYDVLAGLGQRLRLTLEPDEILPTIVTTVREALKLSFVAIEAPRGGAQALVASTGEPPLTGALRLPLTYQGAAVGTLLIAPRNGDDALTPADLRLLDDLTHPIGSAVHTARLTGDLRTLAQDLQRSRERLVTTREEERRRLRRDLHDGLGPTLSAILLNVGLARALSQRAPDSVATLLDALETEIASVISDVRRLVYDLRPPALDELGLVGAIREYVARLDMDAAMGPTVRASDGAARLTVTVEAPDTLPQLPAAVEVAVYRITQEAVTNVIRHSHAGACRVRFRVDQVFEVEVSDDGVGIDAAARAGVGLASMRERAEELDGALTVEAACPRGTRVTACIPLATSVVENSGMVEVRG